MSKLMGCLLAVLLGAATSVSCSGGTPSNNTTPTSTAAAETAPAQLSIDPAGTAVYRDTVGVAALVRNPGIHGVRDIELSVELFAGERPVSTQTDVLAFCPAGATCPWGTSFGVTDNDQRSIDAAEVTITGMGPSFDAGVVRPLDLRVDGSAVSFDLPSRPGVAILYVVDDDGHPYFGMFTSHQLAEKTTIRLMDDTLPIGPRTRGVFYEGHVPDAMNAFGH